MRIAVLGSTGFLGKNIMLEKNSEAVLIATSRQKERADSLYFDMLLPSTWNKLKELRPNVIINAVAYGVVKWQNDIDIMYRTNYLQPMRLYSWLQNEGVKTFWIQVGTAFEYELKEGRIDEQSKCLPETHYGISKLMMSNFLLQQELQQYTIVRPFGMLGSYEDKSKFFPLIINAQKNKTSVALSSGLQQRDYVYVKDVAEFLIALSILQAKQVLPKVINVGSGRALNFKQYASILQTLIPSFHKQYWEWGTVAQRDGESASFYAVNQIATSLGFKITPIEDALKRTIDYYYQ